MEDLNHKDRKVILSSNGQEVDYYSSEYKKCEIKDIDYIVDKFDFEFIAELVDTFDLFYAFPKEGIEIDENETLEIGSDEYLEKYFDMKIPNIEELKAIARGLLFQVLVQGEEDPAWEEIESGDERVAQIYIFRAAYYNLHDELTLEVILSSAFSSFDPIVKKRIVGFQ